MTEESSTFPYPPRPGMPTPETDTSVLEITKLNPEQLSQVLSFESSLTRSDNLTPDSQEPTPGIEKIWEIKNNSTTFWLAYFITDEGRQDLTTTLAVDQLPDFTTDADLINFLQAFDFSRTDPKKLNQLAGRGRQHGLKSVVDQFESTDFSDIAQIQNPKRFTVQRTPEEMVEKMTLYRRLKNYHRHQQKALKDQLKTNPNDALIQAKLAILNIHRRRLNDLIASDYPTSLSIINQADAIQDNPYASEETKTKWLELQQILQLAVTGIGTFKNKGRSYARLDRFRYGAGKLNRATRDYTPLSNQALALAREIKDQNPQIPDIGTSVMSAQSHQRLYRQALEALGLLSSSQDYNPDRQGTAPDNLWQAEIDPNNGALSINRKQKVLKIPDKSRPAIEVIPLTDHEIMHIIQNHNQTLLGLTLAENVGISDQACMEAGALYWENQTRLERYGVQKDLPNPHYLKAMQTKLSGGTFRRVMKTFFDSYISQNPNTNRRSAAELSADRTTRFFRSGESLSASTRQAPYTRILNYLEQHLIRQQLEQEGLEFLLYVGVNSQTFLTLEKVGIINRSQLLIPKNRPTTLIESTIKQELASADNPDR